LGLAHALNGDETQARRFASELEKVIFAGPRNTPGHGFNLARIYVALGDHNQALRAIKRAEKEMFGARLSAFLMGETVLGNKLYLGVDLPKNYMLGKIMLETGEVATAKRGFDKLLEIPQTAENRDIYWMLLLDRGRIAEMEGESEAAIGFHQRAIEVIEDQRSTINTEVNKIGFVGDKQEVYDRIVSLLFEQARYEEAFEYVERAKARALVDMLASRRRFARPAASLQKEIELVSKLAAAEDEVRIQDETMNLDQYGKRRAVVVQLREEIHNADPELASLVTVTPPKVAEIQQLLPSDENLVEYFVAGDTLYTFVVNRKEVRGVQLSVKGMYREIEAFRKHIMAPNSNQYVTDGQVFYEKLIYPVEEMITSKNLTIVPHGALHYIPFNALYSGEGFLIDSYTIRVLPSGSAMKFIKGPNEGQAGTILAFGNPNLGDPIYDLPGAEKEAIAITRAQPNSKLFMRKQATETCVKRFGEHFRYIHFATHATFDAEKPLTSGLLMTADGENDGTLTVGELYDLRLNADLVTLSACETALGKVANGDDVVGFTRGFLYAGANSIVSSLWKVDDQATSILMQEFYKELQEKDKREALRTAQLKVKNTYNSHPYFWAAFQITGAVE